MRWLLLILLLLLPLSSGCATQVLPGAPDDLTTLEASDDDDATEAANDDDATDPADDDDATDALDDDDATDALDDDDAVPEERDEATAVGAVFPSELEPGEAAGVEVTLTNTGTTVWTRDGGYKLGAVDDEDPFFETNRVYLPDDVSVEPGQDWTFEIDLVAPSSEGLYTSDWQMVREGVSWFGEIIEQDVDVVAPVAPGPPPLDLNNVTWLHVDVSGWPVTSTLSSVSMNGSSICLDYDMANVWPINNMNGTDVVGNPWIFIWENNQWYGATWEWLRPGQTCKSSSSVAGDHIKQSPFDEASGWVPTSGVTYYFMVSSLGRFTSVTNVQERTEPMPFVWP